MKSCEAGWTMPRPSRRREPVIWPLKPLTMPVRRDIPQEPLEEPKRDQPAKEPDKIPTPLVPAK